MDLQKIYAFRQEAANEYLIFPSGSRWRSLLETHVPRFEFDLNSGAITLLIPNPARAMHLVRLARKYADSAHYGEHVALLSLIAKRSTLDQQQFVYWGPYFHARPAEEWVSLRAWLTENGQNLDELK